MIKKFTTRNSCYLIILRSILNFHLNITIFNVNDFFNFSLRQLSFLDKMWKNNSFLFMHKKYESKAKG